MKKFRTVVGFEYNVTAENYEEAAEKANTAFREAFHIDNDVVTVVQVDEESDSVVELLH